MDQSTVIQPDNGILVLTDLSRLAGECPGVSSSGGMGQWQPAAGLGALSVAVLTKTF